MTKYFLAAILYLANNEITAQNGNDSLSNTKSCSGGIAYNRFGVCTIKLKDGTRLINCALKEVKQSSIVYQKNRVLHDMAIERIKCIVPENDNFAIWFDEKNSVVAGYCCP